ncbi:MAG TPA: FHA domain-containing protein, partial [Polyangiaceae bacterium]|nr:FHA domain-containing protein [Polyangiaceae bacterium]
CGAPLAGSLSGPAPAAPAPRAPIAEPLAAPAPLPKTGPHPLMPPSAIAAASQGAALAAPSHVAPVVAAPLHASADVARVVQALGSGQAPTPDTVQTRAQPTDAPASASIAADLPPAEPRLRPPAPPTPQRAAATARLVVVVEDGSDGKAFPLASPETIVGRTEGDIMLFDDPYVSPRHARLYEVDGVWRIADLRTVNGVYLKVRGKKPIESGDLILLGSQVLQFQLVSEEERHLGPVSQQGTRVFGSKPVTRLARLDQRSTSGLVADVYYVYRDETVLGREVGDVVFTADAFLSRRHASLRRDPTTNTFSIEDLDSSNGTYLAIRQETALSDGDRLRIGQHLFRFERRAPVAGGSSRGEDRSKGGNANGGAS